MVAFLWVQRWGMMGATVAKLWVQRSRFMGATVALLAKALYIYPVVTLKLNPDSTHTHARDFGLRGAFFCPLNWQKRP
jgi:uncharacterized oligopeptide transporter (OPT) family protein